MVQPRTRLGRRTVTLILAAALAVPVVGIGSAAPVAADCGTDGIRWPSEPSDVRGVAFVGTALARLADTPERGMTSVRIGVDEAFDGAVGATVILTPWCVGTRFVPGQRYLIATSDMLPLPGSEPTTDEHAWFTDGFSVAWRVRGDDRVELLGYGDGSLGDAPAWLRRPSTLRAAVRAVLPSGGDADPLIPAPTPAPTDPPGVVHELLGTTWPEGQPDERVELLRTTLAPGAVMPPTRFAGDWLARVESGTLTVTLVDGAAGIQGFEGSEDDPIGEPRTRTLGAGQLLWSGPDAVLTWENRGTEPVSVLSTAVIDEDDEALVVVDPDASPAPLFNGEVVKRIVLTGPGMTGDRYRITVADRSGRVIGARVPTDRELRFAGGGDPPVDYRDIGIGPVAYLDDNVRELLIWWMGTPCGPVVTVDVAQDLSAIRVVDRTGGCDAAGVGHPLVLRLRGDPPSPADIKGSWVRRR